jgi:hypothetical protein
MARHRGILPLLTLPKVRFSRKRNFRPLSPRKNSREEKIVERGYSFFPKGMMLDSHIFKYLFKVLPRARIDEVQSGLFFLQYYLEFRYSR